MKLRLIVFSREEQFIVRDQLFKLKLRHNAGNPLAMLGMALGINTMIPPLLHKDMGGVWIPVQANPTEEVDKDAILFFAEMQLHTHGFSSNCETVAGSRIDKIEFLDENNTKYVRIETIAKTEWKKLDGIELLRVDLMKAEELENALTEK